MKKFIFLILFLFLSFNCVGAAELGLPIGVMAPDFEVQTDEGVTVKLSDYYAKGPVVLIFYRGAWCPYCNVQLNEFQKNIDAIKIRGANIIALSVDKVEKASEVVVKNSLDFDVLSNPQADVLKSYNLTYQVPADLNKMYKEKYGIDLEASSGRNDGIIAVPATFVIDSTGKIAFAYANEDYKIRTKPEEIIDVLKGL